MSGVACQTAYRAHRDIPPELTAHAVMVYPFGFRWPEPAWRSFELSQRLIDVALAEAGEQALFFGPSEFKVYRPQEDSYLLAGALADAGGTKGAKVLDFCTGTGFLAVNAAMHQPAAPGA